MRKEWLNKCVAVEWMPGRYGFNVSVLYGSWGLHIYLDFCQLSLQIEIRGGQ